MNWLAIVLTVWVLAMTLWQARTLRKLHETRELLHRIAQQLADDAVELERAKTTIGILRTRLTRMTVREHSTSGGSRLPLT